MKTHSTNYYNTLITLAADSKADRGLIPPEKAAKKTVATMQFELLAKYPGTYSSDDLLFSIFAQKNELLADDLTNARAAFFAKGQPCMRTSPLAKSYGWGILADEQGKIKLVDRASDEYEALLLDNKITKIAAMKSKK